MLSSDSKKGRLPRNVRFAFNTHKSVIGLISSIFASTGRHELSEQS